jgi:hypothetical protein
MLQIFQDVFGDMLVSSPIDGNQNQLPSPERLRNRLKLRALIFTFFIRFSNSFNFVQDHT